MKILPMRHAVPPRHGCPRKVRRGGVPHACTYVLKYITCVHVPVPVYTVRGRYAVYVYTRAPCRATQALGGYSRVSTRARALVTSTRVRRRASCNNARDMLKGWRSLLCSILCSRNMRKPSRGPIGSPSSMCCRRSCVLPLRTY